jgi:hypothetical protein
MALALGVSVLFLASYIAYHYQVGSVAFRGSGLIRIAYFTILLSHTVLAVAAVPLVGTVLARAMRRRFKEHARLARVAFPVWLYVSITGVLVYLMLYQMDFPPPPAHRPVAQRGSDEQDRVAEGSGGAGACSRLGGRGVGLPSLQGGDRRPG